MLVQLFGECSKNSAIFYVFWTEIKLSKDENNLFVLYFFAINLIKINIIY